MMLTRLLIKKFRGIKELSLDFSKETVLVGENNTGKTTILFALKQCLEKIRSKKGLVFDEYDFHFESETADPASAKPIEITLIYTEPTEDAWSDEVVRLVAPS